MNPRRWFPKSRVAGWIGAGFGWQRLTRVERGSDGRMLFVDPTWFHTGRRMLRAQRQLRRGGL